MTGDAVIPLSTPALDDRATGLQAAERYLLLADISGYTAFLTGVEDAHGVDLSGGMPAGYEILGRLLGVVVDGLAGPFEVVKIEGDAVFAVAPAESLDGRGAAVLAQLRTVYAAFVATRDAARSSSDHICTACPRVATLDLKVVLHRGMAVRVSAGSHDELHGPSVIVTHRLLKNGVRTRIGDRPYLLLTETAARSLELADPGVAHEEEYAGLDPIDTRILTLA